MNSFDEKWQTLAARARQAPGQGDEAPFGFAGRVVARLDRPTMALLPEMWQTLVLRVLAGAVGLLFLCAALEWPHLQNPSPLQPGIENTVAQLLWTL